MTRQVSSLRLYSPIRAASLAALLGSIILLCLQPGPAQACYSGLVVIPTADILGKGEYVVDLQYDGALAGSSEEARVLNLEFGLTPRLEAGVDFDLSADSDSRVLCNAKYLLSRPDRTDTALALGLCNVGHGSKSVPYLVATHGFGTTRGHLGANRTDGDTNWFVGADRPFGDRFTLFADYTSGDANQSSFGGSYQVNDRYSVMTALLFPNGGGGTEFTVQFVINGSYSRPAEKR